ncbi:MAG: CNNM domain-containing protein [Planctomycetota bacterium]|nr:CNNM domain-containing protein [Planctomycetota bacterium]
MSWIIVLFCMGIFLSAFFSGNETGFYRVTRMRLVMDGLRGDKVAKRLLWLTNNPTLFVSTTLVGNNIANYLTSLAIVMGSQRLLGQQSVVMDVIASIVLTPVIFIYGESLPKNLFLKMPNYLLRKCGLVFLFFFAVLIPVSSLLWLMGRLLEKLVGQSPVKARLALARKELDEILQEGHDAGILQKGQRDLANSMFSVVEHPIREFMKPIHRFQIKQENPDAEQLIAFGKKQKVGFAVYQDERGNSWFYRIVEILIAREKPRVEPVFDVQESDLHGSVLVRMQTEKKPIARVIDPAGRSIGYVTINDLTAPLFAKN